MKINEHTVRFGSGTCVFDFWAWIHVSRTHGGHGAGGEKNEQTKKQEGERVRLVQVPAAFDQTPREHGVLRAKAGGRRRR